MSKIVSGSKMDWKITAEERVMFETQFQALKPQNGNVSGECAKEFFFQSKLPLPVLAVVWELSDITRDGRLNLSEFMIACKLIKMKLRGYALPNVLPAPLMSLVNTNKGGSYSASASLAGSPKTPSATSFQRNNSIPCNVYTSEYSVPMTAVASATTAPLQSPTRRSSINSHTHHSYPYKPQSPPSMVVKGPPTAVVQPHQMSSLNFSQISSQAASLASNHSPLVVRVPVQHRQPSQCAKTMNISSSTAATSETPPLQKSGSLSMQSPPLLPVIATHDKTQPPLSLDISPIGSTDISSVVSNVSTPVVSSVEWSVPHSSKLKYTQMFNQADKDRTGFLTGVQARAILVLTQLPVNTLATVWALSDIDGDGKLSCEEFVLAMHLCDMIKAGEEVNNPLPEHLIPPTYKRQRQNSVGTSATDECIAASSIQSTFEDKRKENFEKGQAELERRRKALLEIQRQEREERDRRERIEEEKREKARLEQEKQRQEEIERQLQIQKEMEREQSEQRRKAMEEKEAARKEMERQKQMEWEKVRKIDLEQQIQKEVELLATLKAKNQAIRTENQQVIDMISGLSRKIGETRHGVNTVKVQIDGMRQTRDTLLGDMTRLKHTLKEYNQRLIVVRQEKAKLENMKQKGEDATVKLDVEKKRASINDYNNKIENLSKEVENAKSNLKTNIELFDNTKQSIAELANECKSLYPEFLRKKDQVLEIKAQKLKDMSSWTNEAWDSAPTAWNDGTPGVVVSSTETKKKKYRALYKFEGRNVDELSIQPGDIILAHVDQVTEPGWLSGEINGKTGWFPESYVESIDDSSFAVNDITSAHYTLGDTPLEGIVEVPENISDSGSAIGEVSVHNNFETTGDTTPHLGMGQAVNVNVEAAYPWKAKSADQLSFNQGDILHVSEKHDQWYYGDMKGISGWFPSAYVKEALSPNYEIQQMDGQYYVALYPYKSSEPGDLCFEQNDVIKVIKKDGQWWTGIINGNEGVFPANYVELMPTQTPSSEIMQASHSVSPGVYEGEAINNVPRCVSAPPTQFQPSQKINVGRAITPDFTTFTGSEQVGSGGKLKKIEIASVIAPYQATSPEQLALQRGQLIMIRKKTSTGWWEGEIQSKGKKRQIGWFPASYVKPIITSGSDVTFNVASDSESSATTDKETKCNQPTLSAAAPAGDDEVIAVFKYTALNEDELNFDKDDVIKIISKNESDWWKGELNGVVGLFPSNYVRPLHVWRKMKGELRRQNHIRELIETEEVYISDMTIVYEVFEKPMIESKILTMEEANEIFVNWREMIVCNQMFLRALKMRRDVSANGIHIIGDILCEYMPRMSAYVRFCSCQLKAAATLSSKQNSSKYKEMIHICQRNPKTKGMPLSSFLIKPMQRITKYPLLIRRILEYTPANHPDYDYLQKALINAEEFCNQVNDGVRQKENADRLEWLQKYVHCDGLPEPLIFNSSTNFMGMRKFLHYGVLRKSKSGKKIAAFLFNDMLLLAQLLKPLFTDSVSLTCSQNFLFSQNVRLKLYKRPIMLNELNTLHSSDKTELRLSYENTIIAAKTCSSVERNMWFRKIQEAKQECLSVEICNRAQRVNEISPYKACGRLLLTMIEGSLLKNSSFGKKAVYCKVSLGCQEHVTPEVRGDAKWNSCLQFYLYNLNEDMLCITVLDRGKYSPDGFLGRTEEKISSIVNVTKPGMSGPIIKTLPLREVDSGSVTVKLDLFLFNMK